MYLTATDGVPHVLRLQVARVRSVMERVILLTVVVEHQPQIDETKRTWVAELAKGFWRVVIHFGYMENPRILPALEKALTDAGAPLSSDVTYYVSRETCVAGEGGKMGPLAEGFFALLSRNAKSPVDYFGLPPDAVVELGTRIDL